MLGLLAHPELFRNLAFQFALVRLVHARAKHHKLLLKCRYFFLPFCFGTAQVRMERIHDRSNNRLWHVDLLERYSQFI